ncbi:MAG: trigger factor [Candidatus Omnitrophota bacterium]|nr:trigger factor [Candidatus Omnitrophota bacterium]
MKIASKKIDGNKRELDIEVSGDIVKNKFEATFKKISQEAKIPGFRPGKAPRDILEKNYSSHAHEQVLRELIPDVYNEAIGKEGLDVIELPEISEVKLDRGRLSFKATVETRPEIQVKDYKGLKVHYKKITVSPDEVKRGLDSLKEQRKVEQLDDKFAHGLGYPDLAQLEKMIELQLLAQKESHERQRIENEIVEGVVKDLQFSLPQGMIKHQLQELVRQAKLDLALKGVAREKIDEQEPEMLKALEPQAREQVKVYLVLSEIAKKENIPVDDHMPRKVIELLLREADWQIA